MNVKKMELAEIFDLTSFGDCLDKQYYTFQLYNILKTLTNRSSHVVYLVHLTDNN